VAILRADAQRNRQQLMTAAAELFAERGVDVPLDEIARRAGVSIGTLYNHFPNRGVLLDAVLPDWAGELERLAQDALADPDVWRGFAGFMDGLFALQASNRPMNDTIERTPRGPVDVAAECGRTGGVLESVVNRARNAGALRPDFRAADLGTMIAAMAKVITLADGNDEIWRRHLGFVLDGLRATR
jgi:AcrR family transcriptional regulator